MLASQIRRVADANEQMRMGLQLGYRSLDCGQLHPALASHRPPLFSHSSTDSAFSCVGQTSTPPGLSQLPSGTCSQPADSPVSSCGEIAPSGPTFWGSGSGAHEAGWARLRTPLLDTRSSFRLPASASWPRDGGPL